MNSSHSYTVQTTFGGTARGIGWYPHGDGNFIRLHNKLVPVPTVLQQFSETPIEIDVCEYDFAMDWDSRTDHLRADEIIWAYLSTRFAHVWEMVSIFELRKNTDLPRALLAEAFDLWQRVDGIGEDAIKVWEHYQETLAELSELSFLVRHSSGAGGLPLARTVANRFWGLKKLSNPSDVLEATKRTQCFAYTLDNSGAAIAAGPLWQGAMLAPSQDWLNAQPYFCWVQHEPKLTIFSLSPTTVL